MRAEGRPGGGVCTEKALKLRREKTSIPLRPEEERGEKRGVFPPQHGQCTGLEGVLEKGDMARVLEATGYRGQGLEGAEGGCVQASLALCGRPPLNSVPFSL